MNSDADSDLPPDETNSSVMWRVLGQWPVIVFVYIALMALTYNPLIAGCLPYLKAGWPAAQTAFWLKWSDPWRARGTVGFLFHLCMALFRAGACGTVCIIGMAVVFHVRQQQPNLIPVAVAISTILLGCILSSILGGIGVFIALRHGIRIYVATKLFKICRGDFAVAKTLAPRLDRTNPGNFIIIVAIVTPIMAFWFGAMLTTLPNQAQQQQETLPVILLLLPVLCIAGIAAAVWLSGRIMARTPAECWGAHIPESEKEDANWYQRAE